jgi:hypothetical protein
MPEDINVMVVHPYACPKLPYAKIYTVTVSLQCEEGE